MAEPVSSTTQADALHLTRSAGKLEGERIPRTAFGFVDYHAGEKLAESLLRRGADAVVVRRWSVGNVDARPDTSAFYEAALSGDVPVAEVLRRLRNRSGPQQSAKTAEALQFIGHAGFRLQRVWPAQVWGAFNGWRLATLDGHTARVTHAAWAPDGARVVTGSIDGTVRLWDVTTAREVWSVAFGDGPVSALTVSPDGTRAAAEWNGTSEVVWWDLVTGSRLSEVGPSSGRVVALAFAPDGRPRVLDDTSGSRLTPDAITAGAFSPDGLRSAVAFADGAIVVSDASGVEMARSGEISASITSIEFSADGTQLLVPVGEGVRVLDATSLSEIMAHRGSGIVNAASVPRSGDRIAVATAGGEVMVRDWAGGSVSLRIPAFDSRRSGVAFSPDGTKLLTWSAPIGLRRPEPEQYDAPA